MIQTTNLSPSRKAWLMSRGRCCLTVVFFLIAWLMTPFAVADSVAPSCKGHFVNPITDVDWDALFPITIGDADVVSGDLPDTSNPSSPICVCPSTTVGVQVGLSFGYWEPFALADVTPDPWCMVNMGFSMDITSVGYGDTSPPSSNINGRGSFYEVHWYVYPAVFWLNVITDLGCMETGDMDVAYLSELDPSWGDDELSFVIDPESSLFANPVALSSCAADAVAAMTDHPIDKLFWCMGSQGDVYPMDGTVAFPVASSQASLLDAEKMDYKLHREGLILDTVGQDAPALCSQYPSAYLPKERYRYQLVNVIPDSTEAFAFGHTSMEWEAGHMMPQDGDNFGYLIFRKRNCCFL